MRKQKEQPVTVTHAEVLCWAINWLGERWMKDRENLNAFEEKDPELAKQFFEQNLWRQKLKVAVELYKIETGKEFCGDFEID